MADAIPSEFKCTIVTPDQVIFEGPANRVFAPGPQGELAVLPLHTPFYCQLIAGNVKVTTTKGATEEFPIDGGVLRVRENSVTIIVGF